MGESQVTGKVLGLGGPEEEDRSGLRGEVHSPGHLMSSSPHHQSLVYLTYW